MYLIFAVFIAKADTCLAQNCGDPSFLTKKGWPEFYNTCLKNKRIIKITTINNAINFFLSYSSKKYPTYIHIIQLLDILKQKKPLKKLEQICGVVNLLVPYKDRQEVQLNYDAYYNLFKCSEKTEQLDERTVTNDLYETKDWFKLDDYLYIFVLIALFLAFILYLIYSHFIDNQQSSHRQKTSSASDYVFYPQKGKSLLNKQQYTSSTHLSNQLLVNQHKDIITKLLEPSNIELINKILAPENKKLLEDFLNNKSYYEALFENRIQSGSVKPASYEDIIDKLVDIEDGGAAKELIDNYVNGDINKGKVGRLVSDSRDDTFYRFEETTAGRDLYAILWLKNNSVVLIPCQIKGRIPDNTLRLIYTIPQETKIIKRINTPTTITIISDSIDDIRFEILQKGVIS
jgi:hypothetical protein